MNRRLFVTALAAAVAATTAAPLAMSPPLPAATPVYSVSSVKLESVPGDPGAVRIVAQGRVNTTGWRDARLVLDPIASGPKGVMTFVMVARPPRGIAGMAFTTVSASTVLPALPDGVHTIHIKSRFGRGKSVSVASLTGPRPQTSAG